MDNSLIRYLSDAEGNILKILSTERYITEEVITE